MNFMKDSERPSETNKKETKDAWISEDDYMDALLKASKPVRKTTVPNQLDDENESEDEE